MTTPYEFRLTADEMEEVIEDNLALQSENIELRTRLDQASVDAENAKAMREKVSLELEQSEGEMVIATTQLNKQSDRIRQLENEVKELRERTDNNLNQTVLQMHEKLEEIDEDSELPLLEEKLELLEGQLTDAKQFNSKADQLIEDVRKQLASQIGETEKCRSLNFVEELKISENGKLIAKLEEENDRQEKQIIELQNESLSASHSDFSIKFNELKYEPIDKLIEKIDERDRQVADVESSIDECREELTVVRERNAVLETENQVFEQQKLNAEATKEGEITELKELTEIKTEQFEYQMLHCQEQLMKQEEQLKRLTAEKEEAIAENERLRSEMGKKIIKYQENELADIDEMLEENKAQKTVIEQLESDLTLLERECLEKNSKIEKLRKKVASEKAELGEAQSIVLSLKAAVFGTEFERDAPHSASGYKVDELMRQIRALEDSVEANADLEEVTPINFQE